MLWRRSTTRFEVLMQFIELLALEAEIGVLPAARAEELIRFSADELVKVAPRWKKDIALMADLTIENLPR